MEKSLKIALLGGNTQYPLGGNKRVTSLLLIIPNIYVLHVASFIKIQATVNVHLFTP